MFQPRRTLLGLCLSLTFAGAALADDKYPSKPVTVIVPQAAGGANDAIARVVAQKLTELLGQSFIVENRTGAGGNVGTVAAARARPDGYTIMLTADSSMVINPSLYKSTGFDPIKDFEPVGTVATAGYVLVANPAFPAKNTAELVALAKQQPGKINIGSAGNGTLNHLIGEMLGKATGIDLTHVPYKGSSAAVTDLVAGQVQVSVQSLPSSIAFIRSGKIKVLGVVNQKRLPSLPEAPTSATKPQSAADVTIARATCHGKRRRGRPRVVSHPITAATSDTFHPEIATRCDAPVALNAARTVGGTPVRSPSKMPVASDASGSGSHASIGAARRRRSRPMASGSCKGVPTPR